MQCEECEERHSKYVCPRCKTKTCSLACYQSHDRDCLQLFQDSAVGPRTFVSAQQRRDFQQKMRAQRLENDEDVLQDEIRRLERFEELGALAEEDKLTADSLTLEEQQQFEAYVRGLELEKPWNPIWYVEEGKFSLYVEELDAPQQPRAQFLEQINHDADEEDDYFLTARYSALKDFIRGAAKFEKLSKKAPDASLVHHVASALFASCLLLRHFDGDVAHNADEFVLTLERVCDVLGRQERLDLPNLEAGVRTVMEKATALNADLAHLFQAALTDLQHVLSDKFYVMEILFHLSTLYAKQIEAETAQRATKGASLLSRHRATHFKLQYFASYVRDFLTPQHLRDLRLLALTLEYDYQKQQQTIREFRDFKKRSLIL